MRVRVASLLNVNPVKSDPGQPVRLALNAAPAVVATAETPAEDYAQEVASFDQPAAVPVIGEAPVVEASAEFVAEGRC